MFGIGGGELIFIIFVVLMLFGADKVPEIARTLGKAMSQLKHATNDIKNEIQKGAENSGLNTQELHEYSKHLTADVESATQNVWNDSTKEVTKIAEDIETITGPVKRQR